MAAALGCQETTEDTKEGVEQQRVMIEIMAIKIQLMYAHIRQNVPFSALIVLL